jgi:hypothetical protein
MTTDEVVVQSSMLTLSSHKFVITVVQNIVLLFSTCRFQYKFLLSNDSLQWVKASAQSTLCESSQNLLLTHEGALFKIDYRQDPDVYGRRNGHCTHDFIGDLSMQRPQATTRRTGLMSLSSATRNCDRPYTLTFFSYIIKIPHDQIISSTFSCKVVYGPETCPSSIVQSNVL